MALVLLSFLFLVNYGNEFCSRSARVESAKIIPALAGLILAADMLATAMGCAFDFVLRSAGAKLRFSPLFVFVLVLALCNRLPDTLYDTRYDCVVTDGYGMLFALVWSWLLALACAAREVFTVISIQRNTGNAA